MKILMFHALSVSTADVKYKDVTELYPNDSAFEICNSASR